MQALLDGYSVLYLHKEAIAVFFVTILGLGNWAAGLWSNGRKYEDHIRLPLALCLGVLVLVLISFSLVLLGHFWPSVLRLGSALVLLLGFAACAHMLWRRAVSLRSFFVFCAVLFFLLLIRLAFLKGILLPPYDDSSEHYEIVQSFLSSARNGGSFYSIANLARHYYHFGFQSIAAWLCSITGADAADAIALLGQLFLVVSPVSIFLLACVLTNEIRGGLVAASFTAFAWRMPAFATNWGKYPAGAGLALFPAVVALWVLARPAIGRKRAAPLVFLTVALVFIHSRLLVCLGLALVGYLLARQLPIRRPLWFWEAAALAVLTVATGLLFGNSLLVYYGNGYYLALGCVGLLAAFAFFASPRLAISITFFIFAVWVAFRSPTFFESISSTWLDQPFVEMLLYIPLSLLAGVGLVGLPKRLPDPRLERLAILVVMGVVVTGFLSSHVIYPDSCCNYVKRGDLLAFRWLRENTPPDAVVWTAALKSRNYLVGLDAGVWVSAMSGRNVNRLRYDFDWGSPDAPSDICQPYYQAVYIYKGGMPYSFDDVRLEQQEWLRRVFVAGATKIYQVEDPCIRQTPH